MCVRETFLHQEDPREHWILTFNFSALAFAQEAVRAGPGWNSTLLVFMWDDPGGFYDHVPTPLSAPAPDSIPSCPDKGFKFDRLGSRLPFVAISPWIPKGTVVGDPEDPPFPDSKFDSTSLIGTIKEIFNLPSFLTKRDAWSGKFTSLFHELDEPRTDAPLHLPEAPLPGKWSKVGRGLPRRSRGNDGVDGDGGDDGGGDDDLDVGSDGDGDNCDQPR